MAELKIFIAGSKELKTERNGIKIIANDLSSLYSSRGIHITANSYEHFDENQDSYNRFIVEEADIVVFILDGYIGSKTEEEFIAATKSLNEKNHPDIMIFIREYDGEAITPNIARIQGLIAGCLGNSKYYVEYSSLEDLKTKARERIMRYVDKFDSEVLQEEEKHPFLTTRRTKNPYKGVSTIKTRITFWKYLSISLIAVLLAISTLFVLNKNAQNGSEAKEPQSLLIFSGGGSVVDFIKKITDNTVNVKDYDSSTYINLPSGSAWTLLTEEAIRWNEKKTQPFISIVLSADRMDQTSIDYKADNIRNQACITGYFLGYDTLTVYIDKEFAKERHLPIDTINEISAEKFTEIISFAKNNTDKVNLFTTNKSSGTLRMYQRIVDEVNKSLNFEDMLKQKQSHSFYQYSSSDYLHTLNGQKEGVPYIMLGSESYYSRKVNDYYKYHIYANGEIQMKEMYIYFMAYKNIKDDKYYFSPKVLDFLKKLGADKTLPENIWNELSECRIPDRRGNIIMHLNK